MKPTRVFVLNGPSISMPGGDRKPGFDGRTPSPLSGAPARHHHSYVSPILISGLDAEGQLPAAVAA